MSLLDSVPLSSVMPSSPERAYQSYNYESYQVCVVSHASRLEIQQPLR